MVEALGLGGSYSSWASDSGILHELLWGSSVEAEFTTIASPEVFPLYSYSSISLYV